MRNGKRSVGIRILRFLGYFALSVVVSFVIGCISINIKHKVNVFKLGGQIKKLNQPVNIERLVTNPHTLDDMAAAKRITDECLNGLITYSEQDGYKIEPDKISSNMLKEIRFTDKQIAAILDTIMTSTEEGGEDVEETYTEYDKVTRLEESPFRVFQVELSNITETTVDFNIVLNMDLVLIKKEMTMFPFSAIKKITPNQLCISATSTITKGEKAFEYSTEGKKLVVNNLSTAETDYIIRALDIIMDIESSKKLAESLCTLFINALIGTEVDSGIGYALKDMGATDFAFETDGTNNYLVIKK